MRSSTEALRAVPLVALGALLVASDGAAVAQDGPAFCLTILHNNDAESQLLDAGSELESYGGAATFVSLVEHQRAAAAAEGCAGLDAGDVPRAVVTLSSGDNFLAGPEFNASLEKGPPFYDSMVVNAIDYDALAIGNHEFDFGPEVLADFIEGVDPEVPFLSANLDVSAEPRLQALAEAGRIAGSVVLERDGERIAVIGATTEDLPFISSPRGVTVGDVAQAVRAEIEGLPDEVDKIILISHLQSVNEDVALLAELEGIDVAIAGGGDELLANPDTPLVPGDEEDVAGPYPMMVPDASGKEVPVVTTSGNMKYLGRLEVLFDDQGEVLATAGRPVRVVQKGADDAVAPDPDVVAEVTAPVAAALEEAANTVIGTTEVPLNGRRSDIRTRETNLGILVADALLVRARAAGGEFGIDQVDIGLQNGGGIRNDSVLPAGEITELDTFDILPFSNFVTVVEDLEPADLKLIMENAVSAVEDGGGAFAQIAGFTLVYDPSAAALELDDAGAVVTEGQRVKDIALDDGTKIVADGTVVEGAPAVNLATIDFLARGGDQYPFGADATFTPVGVSYQQALSRFIEEDLGGKITADAYPEDGTGRIKTVE
jgi:5'-nucleotidase/UDP-sugar diphosphatase